MSSGEKAKKTLRRLVNGLIDEGYLESEEPYFAILYPSEIEPRFLNDEGDLATNSFYLINDRLLKHVWKVVLSTDTAYELNKSDDNEFWKLNLWKYEKTLGENSAVSCTTIDYLARKQLERTLKSILRYPSYVDDIVIREIPRTRYEHNVLRAYRVPHYCMRKVVVDYNVPYREYFRTGNATSTANYELQFPELPRKAATSDNGKPDCVCPKRTKHRKEQ